MFGLGYPEVFISTINIVWTLGILYLLYKTYMNIGRIADAVEKLADKK